MLTTISLPFPSHFPRSIPQKVAGSDRQSPAATGALNPAAQYVVQGNTGGYVYLQQQHPQQHYGAHHPQQQQIIYQNHQHIQQQHHPTVTAMHHHPHYQQQPTHYANLQHQHQIGGGAVVCHPGGPMMTLHKKGSVRNGGDVMKRTRLQNA